MAYIMLDYGVEHRAGFTQITGDVGCGKTTLIRHLLNILEQDVTVGRISNSQKAIGALLKWVPLSFDQSFEFDDKVALFDRLQRFLIDGYGSGRHTMLIIDEAQNLSASTIEELRVLSNINVDKDHLLQLVLVGQPQLKRLLRRPELEQFAQRVLADFHIGVLQADEVVEFVNDRLAVAGRKAMLFADDALLRIAHSTHGVPRRLNILCATALVYGFSLEAEIITAGSSTRCCATRRVAASCPARKTMRKWARSASLKGPATRGTDAWDPQTNGVARTLGNMPGQLRIAGHEVEIGAMGDLHRCRCRRIARSRCRSGWADSGNVSTGSIPMRPVSRSNSSRSCAIWMRRPIQV